MEATNAQALAELTQSILDEGIVDPLVFNVMVQKEDHLGIINLDGMLREYFTKGGGILRLAKAQLDSEDPQYPLIDNILGNLEAASPGVAAKKVHMSITPVRLCLTGDPEDLDVAKSALGTLERDFRVFESKLRKFIELKKQVYIFDRNAAAAAAAAARSQRE